MLKKVNIITRKKEINKIFKNGKSSFDKIIGIKSFDNDLKINRFVIIIGTKVSKKAVVRNKLKRIIRSILSSEKNKIKIKQDCVIIVLPEIIKNDYTEIKKSIIKHFNKLRLLSN